MPSVRSPKCTLCSRLLLVILGGGLCGTGQTVCATPLPVLKQIATPAGGGPGSGISVAELLSLPTANRESFMKNLSNPLYEQIKALAFSEKQSLGVRWRALVALGQSRNPMAKEDLLTASRDSTWYMRNASLLALDAFNPEDALDVAKRLVRDKSLVVRSAAVDSLKRFASTEEVRDILWEELTKKYNFINKQSLWVRHQIVECLAAAPLKTEQDKFEKLLGEEDLRVAYFTATALERLYGKYLGTTDEPIKKIKLWRAQIKKSYIELD